MVHAVVQVIMDQLALGGADGFLHRVQLLSHVHTLTVGVHHRYDVLQMTAGAPQALDNRLVRSVKVRQ